MQAIFLAIYLLVGEFKADERLAFIPFDLTVATAGALTLFALWRVLRMDVRYQKQLVWLIIGVSLFAIPLLWTVWTDYAMEKSSRMFTLSLLAFAAPLLLITERDDLRLFRRALTVIALMIAADAMYTLWTEMGTFKEEARLTATGSGTIALGRASGIALIGFLVARGKRRWLRLLMKATALLVLVPVIFASGSRGPLMAIGVTLVLFFLMFNARTLKQWLVMILTVGLFGLALLIGSEIAPEGSRSRMEESIRNDPFEDTRENASAATRIRALKISVKKGAVTPLGIGWGGFAGMAQEMGITYPHNLIVEIFLEGGWVPGALVLLAFYVIFRRSAKHARATRSVNDQWIFLLAVFMFVNAQVSGDFNDNRLLYALLALASMVCMHDVSKLRKKPAAMPATGAATPTIGNIHSVTKEAAKA